MNSAFVILISDSDNLALFPTGAGRGSMSYANGHPIWCREDGTYAWKFKKSLLSLPQGLERSHEHADELLREVLSDIVEVIGRFRHAKVFIHFGGLGCEDKKPVNNRLKEAVERLGLSEIELYGISLTNRYPEKMFSEDGRRYAPPRNESHIIEGMILDLQTDQDENCEEHERALKVYRQLLACRNDHGDCIVKRGAPGYDAIRLAILWSEFQKTQKEVKK